MKGLCSIATGYKILINQSKCSKKDFSDVSLDNKTGLCSIATGRTNDNIVCILWELCKLIIHSLGQDFLDVSLDETTGLCYIATGRTNDNIVCILWELHKLILCSIVPC